MRAPRGRSLLRWALATILVGLVCWLPTIIDQVSSRPGNLSLVARSVTTPVTTLGARVGAHAVARAIGWRPWWLTVPGTRWDRYHDVDKGKGKYVKYDRSSIAAIFLSLY